MTLNDLCAGAEAVITTVEVEDASLRAKYISRGIVAGAELSVLRTGSAIVIALDQTRWAINRDEAHRIGVILVGARRRWRFGRKRR